MHVEDRGARRDARGRLSAAARLMLAVAASASTALVLDMAQAAPASASAVTVTQTTVTATRPGVTTTLKGISVSGFSPGTTLLVTVSATLGTLSLPTTTGLTLSYGYSSFSGSTLSFTGSQADVDGALAGLTLESTDEGLARVSLTVLQNHSGIAYLPDTGHFYEFVSDSDVSWTTAQTDAEALNFDGQPGYLASIPDATTNTFIADDVEGAHDVWVGGEATDYPAGYDGDPDIQRVWAWSGGPLAGQIFTECTLVTGTCIHTNDSGDYTSWNTGEPNDSGYTTPGTGEWVMETNTGGAPGLWNDLDPTNDSGVDGYVAEFGGLTNTNVGGTGFSGVYGSVSDVYVQNVPATPTSVTAAAGVDSATVSWRQPLGITAIPAVSPSVAPRSIGLVTSWSIHPYDEATGTALPPTVVPGEEPGTRIPVTSRHGTVTGLTAGHAYTFTVEATDHEGASPASSPSNPVEPIGHAPAGTGSGTASGGTASASTGSAGTSGYIGATATGGTGTVTVENYGGDPVAGLHAGTSFYDVEVSRGATFTKVTFEICGVPAGGTVLWWDPVTLQLVAPSEETAPWGPGGCVTVTVTASTTPDLAELYGTVFAVAPAGYRLAGSDGGVFDFEGVAYEGSASGVRLNAPIVGMAATPDNGGYWLVGADGGVFAYGDAVFYGSAEPEHLSAPVVGIEALPDGKGYWLVGADGGVFTFGAAPYLGSLGGDPPPAKVVGMVATTDGRGYRLVSADGGVYSYGDAAYYGSAEPEHLNAPVVGMAATPDGRGYWLVSADGGVFTYGDAGYHGSLGGDPPRSPVIGLTPTVDGKGYWLASADGGVYSYGDAQFYGSVPGLGLHPSGPIVAVS